jgi:hypothetical protein
MADDTAPEQQAAPGPGSYYLSPRIAPAAGGRLIQIVGHDFTPTNTTVSVGGVAATNVVPVSSFLLDCNVPAHAAGAADVIVTTPNGTGPTLTGAVTYV